MTSRETVPAVRPTKAAPLRAVYYSSAIQLEPVLSLVPEMNRRTEFHLLLELSPEAWSSALFDVPPRHLPGGIVPGDAVLRDSVPPSIRAYWQRATSFHLIVHDCRRSVHPRTWWRSLQAARFIRALRPDVLHLDNLSLRLAPLLWSLRHIPMVLTLHDPEPHSGEDNWRVSLGRRLTFPQVDRFFLLNRSGVAGVSQRFGIAPGRLDTGHLGVHGLVKEWLAEPPAEEPRTVLFFGRMSRYKGLDVFYRAATLVAAKLDAVRFVVAGRSFPGYALPPEPELPRGGSVEVLHRYMHNRETAELFARATVVACPYLDATQSGVVLTAFAFGKPVVATRVGGLPEYVQDGVNGLLVEPGDAEALAAAILRLLQEPGLREHLRAGIAAQTETTISWAMAAEKIAASYHRAVGRRS